MLSAPAIFRYTASAAPERHFEAAACLQADLKNAGMDDAGEALALRLIDLMRKTEAPNGLAAVGFSAADVPALAASSARQVRAINNAPRDTNQVDIENIYTAALSY